MSDSGRLIHRGDFGRIGGLFRREKAVLELRYLGRIFVGWDLRSDDVLEDLVSVLNPDGVHLFVDAGKTRCSLNRRARSEYLDNELGGKRE